MSLQASGALGFRSLRGRLRFSWQSGFPPFPRPSAFLLSVWFSALLSGSRGSLNRDQTNSRQRHDDRVADWSIECIPGDNWRPTSMLRLRDIMTTDVLPVSPETSVRDAMELLARHHVSGAPVIANHQLVGVVTTTDLLM